MMGALLVAMFWIGYTIYIYNYIIIYREREREREKEREREIERCDICFKKKSGSHYMSYFSVCGEESSHDFCKIKRVAQ